jgi:hypothetical protein
LYAQIIITRGIAVTCKLLMLRSRCYAVDAMKVKLA